VKMKITVNRLPRYAFDPSSSKKQKPPANRHNPSMGVEMRHKVRRPHLSMVTNAGTAMLSKAVSAMIAVCSRLNSSYSIVISHTPHPNHNPFLFLVRTAARVSILLF
jgi:gluconate kinase